MNINDREFRIRVSELRRHARGPRRILLSSLAVIVFFSIYLCSVAFSTAEAAGGLFDAERLQLTDQLLQVLIQSKVCSEKNDCVKKQIVFVAGERKGLEVSIYAVNDRPALVLLVSTCSDMFFSSNKELNINIKIKRVTKSEELAAPFWKPVSAREVSLRRND